MGRLVGAEALCRHVALTLKYVADVLDAGLEEKMCVGVIRGTKRGRKHVWNILTFTYGGGAYLDFYEKDPLVAMVDEKDYVPAHGLPHKELGRQASAPCFFLHSECKAPSPPSPSSSSSSASSSAAASGYGPAKEEKGGPRFKFLTHQPISATKATVCLAEWEGQQVVAKRYGNEHAQKFAHELRVRMLIKTSPAMCPLISVDPSARILVMPYRPLGSLHTFLTDLDREPTAALLRNLFAACVEAVAEMHSVCGPSFGHFDIKPDNLLVASQNKDTFTVEVTDFGHAACFQHRVEGPWRGTKGYEAREQGYKDVPLDGEKCDVFALGKTALWILSGRTSSDVQCVKHPATTFKFKKPPSAHCKPFSEAQWWILVHCLDDTPSKRPPLSALRSAFP